MYEAPVLVDLQDVVGQDGPEPVHEKCGLICITGGESVVSPSRTCLFFNDNKLTSSRE